MKGRICFFFFLLLSSRAFSQGAVAATVSSSTATTSSVAATVSSSAAAAASADFPLLEGEAREVIGRRDTAATIRSSVKKVRIYLNGDYQGNSPLTLKSLAPGFYHLHLEKKGYEAADYMIELSYASHDFYYVQLRPLALAPDGGH